MEPLSVPVELSSLSLIRQYVAETAKAAGLDERAAYRLRLAVDEIATNILTYGYGTEPRPDAMLRLYAQIDGGKLQIIMEDNGAAYDPRQAPAPDDLEQPLEERDMGGLGIYLMLQSVDEFQYERTNGLNRSIFVIYRTGSASAPTAAD